MVYLFYRAKVHINTSRRRKGRHVKTIRWRDQKVGSLPAPCDKKVMVLILKHREPLLLYRCFFEEWRHYVYIEQCRKGLKITRKWFSFSQFLFQEENWFFFVFVLHLWKNASWLMRQKTKKKIVDQRKRKHALLDGLESCQKLWKSLFFQEMDHFSIQVSGHFRRFSLVFSINLLNWVLFFDSISGIETVRYRLCKKTNSSGL